MLPFSRVTIIGLGLIGTSLGSSSSFRSTCLIMSGSAVYPCAMSFGMVFEGGVAVAGAQESENRTRDTIPPRTRGAAPRRRFLVTDRKMRRFTLSSSFNRGRGVPR